jgi:hypothetical protein
MRRSATLKNLGFLRCRSSEKRPWKAFFTDNQQTLKRSLPPQDAAISDPQNLGFSGASLEGRGLQRYHRLCDAVFL